MFKNTELNTNWPEEPDRQSRVKGANSRPRSIYETSRQGKPAAVLPRAEPWFCRPVLKVTEQVTERVRANSRRDLPLRPALETSADLLQSMARSQWLEIKHLLIQDPELLMLDEPGGGHERALNVKATAETCCGGSARTRSVNRSSNTIWISFKDIAQNKVTGAASRANCWPRARWK